MGSLQHTSRKHCPKFEFCLHIEVQPPTQVRFKTREQKGISSHWNQSWEEERRAQQELLGSSRSAHRSPGSQGSSNSASKLHKSDQANPVLGEDLFLTQARSRKTKAMSEQIFEDAVLSCVDCGAGGSSSGIRRGICPQLGSQTLLLPAWECPSGPLCP